VPVCPNQRHGALWCLLSGDFERALFAVSTKFPLLKWIKSAILADKPPESGECRIRIRETKKMSKRALRSILVAALLSLLIDPVHLALSATRSDECDPKLFQDYKSDVTNDNVTLSVLKIVSEKTFDQFKSNFGANIVIPLFGIPIDFGATWASFNQKRTEVFQKYKLNYNEQRARDYVEFKFSDNGTRAYVKCIEGTVLKQRGLHLAWGDTGNQSPTLIITWFDTPQPHPPERTVNLKIASGRTTTNSRVNIFSGGRQTLLIPRDSKLDTTVAGNIRGVDSAEATMPADPVVIPPEKPIAYTPIYRVPDSSHTLAAQTIFQRRNPTIVGYSVRSSSLAPQPIFTGLKDGCNAGYIGTNERLYDCVTDPLGFLLKENFENRSIPVVIIQGNNNICRTGSLATADTSCPHSETIGWLLGL
jgi:hypothetical protein